MKAINNYVVIEKIKQSEKKIAGLIVTQSTDTEAAISRGRIISRPDEFGKLEEGSVIRYLTGAGWDISHEEKVYRVIRVGDIVIIE